MMTKERQSYDREFILLLFNQNFTNSLRSMMFLLKISTSESKVNKGIAENAIQFEIR